MIAEICVQLFLQRRIIAKIVCVHGCVCICMLVCEEAITLSKSHFFPLVTLKCLSIGTPKIINFPFVSNGKLMIFRCPNIQTDYNEAVLCLNFGTPENNEFSIWD